MSETAKPSREAVAHPRTEDDETGPPGLARLLAFSDGVFAIAITILVLPVDVPPGLTATDLRAAVVQQGPQLLSAALSFVVIARFWIAHHGLYQHVRVVDGPQLALGTAVLAPIVVIPFVTELLADYAGTSLAVILYSAVVAWAALAEVAVLFHGTRSAVLRGPRSDSARQKLVGTFAAALGFLVAIPVALVDPNTAKLCWLLSVAPVPRWVLGRRARPPG
jgi:uncharacterized membrane protein